MTSARCAARSRILSGGGDNPQGRLRAGPGGRGAVSGGKRVAGPDSAAVAGSVGGGRGREVRLAAALQQGAGGPARRPG